MRRNSRLPVLAGFAVAVILLAAGGLLLWGSTYVHNTVQGQLAAQQIFFPPKAAFAHPVAGTEITPSMIPSVSQYAGQQLLTGQQAEAYADHFIAVHIANMCGGKTYSQLSAESIAQPNNAKLAGLVATVFKGETLRSMLLNAYGWWKVSQITYIAAIVAFALGGLALLGLAVRADPRTPPRDRPRDHRRHPRHARMTPTRKRLRPAPATGRRPRPPSEQERTPAMFQVRFHGRGGQGVVTAAELLASAAFSEGKHAQAFPSFGSERMGAPVMSFCRIDDKEIRTHEPVSEPDALIIQDPTLLHQAELFAGLGHEGYMLINSTHSFDELGLEEFVKDFHRDRLLVVPASSLALTHLGRPLPGAALLGGFAALTWAVSLDSVLAAINDKFAGPVAEGNAAAARAAFAFVRDEREALTRGP